MTTRHFIIATAGHVDHGKSALVKALTGTDPDRLPEEKKRQITIDLGFAALNVTAPNGDKIHAGIVDVPGHEDFVRNMIAGVGSIDLALFVVAADDGWMPQSEEHLQILNYLGVQRAVIALTKSDLGRIDVVTNQIREQLTDTPFADSPIVPTSVRTGTGIEKLVNTLASSTRKNGAPTRHPQAALVYRSGVHAPWDRHSCDGNTNRRILAPRPANRCLPDQSRNTYSFDSEPRPRTGSRAAGNAHRHQSTGPPRRSDQARRRGDASGSRRANFDSDCSSWKSRRARTATRPLHIP